MKIIDIHKTTTATELLQIIQEKLNPYFHEQRNSGLNFISEIKDGVIEISQPDVYEGFLFRIEIRGNELWITRSEHYVDDVNSLTVESILSSLFEKISGDDGNHLVLEG
jgi:hypothetical protein